MNDSLSKLHRALLWLTVVPCATVGIGSFLAPVQFQSMLGLQTPDPTSTRSIGGFLLSAAIAAWYSLRSGKWSEVRLVTLYLSTWKILVAIGILFGLLARTASLALLPNLILLSVVGTGLAYVYWQRR